MELCGSKVQLVPAHRNLIHGVVNPEIVYISSVHNVALSTFVGHLFEFNLSSRFQRSIISSSFSRWNELITGSEYSLMAVKALFINQEKIRKRIKNGLELDFMILHKWFHENHISTLVNVIGNNNTSCKIILKNKEITSSGDGK